MKNLDRLYENLFSKMRAHRIHMQEHVENYEEGNAIALEIDAIGRQIEENDPQFVEKYLAQIEKEPQFWWALAIRMREYNGKIAHDTYQAWYLSNPIDNWVWEYILDSWNEDQKRIEDENREKILRYKQMKING